MESKFRHRIYPRQPGLGCTNPKLLSEKKEEVLIRLPPIDLAASAYGLVARSRLNRNCPGMIIWKRRQRLQLSLTIFKLVTFM
jgi:hypothetical protein